VEITHGFFEGRCNLEVRITGGGPKAKRLAKYLNVPAPIGILVSKRLATLHELDTVYGVKDCYDMLEIATIDDYNAEVMRGE
jgi:hypothetical protein